MPIRQARAADLPTIVAIYNSTVAGRQVTADLHPVSVDERQTWFDSHQKPHRPMMVLCDAVDQVLAWARSAIITLARLTTSAPKSAFMWLKTSAANAWGKPCWMK